jgi:lipoyl(octanoyl) transferase
MTARVLEVVLGGLVPYADALAMQRQMAAARLDRSLDHDALLLLEHPPVITLGRTSKREHLLDSGDVPVFEVERGGDVTFHGPGQLVGYPIVDLTQHRQDLHWYLRKLEQVLIDALATLGISAERRAGYTGVWTGGRKIASIGVHVKQWVTWHGFALNVSTDLSSFERIVPCGIDGVTMTSIEREIGVASWGGAVDAVIQSFATLFEMDPALKGGLGPMGRVLKDATRSAEPGLQPTE